jgi:hypothetical protein
VRLRGYFRKGTLDAAYAIAVVAIPSLHVRQSIEFLIDTGATRTTILDRDAVTLGLSYTKLHKLKQPLLGLGGLIETYVARDSALYFKTEDGFEHKELAELLVVKHKKVDENIMRIPSVLGRDILNKYKLVYDRQHGLAVITDEV